MNCAHVYVHECMRTHTHPKNVHRACMTPLLKISRKHHRVGSVLSPTKWSETKLERAKCWGLGAGGSGILCTAQGARSYVALIILVLPRKVKYGITIPHWDFTLRNRAQRIRKSKARQTLLSGRMVSTCSRVEDA